MASSGTTRVSGLGWRGSGGAPSWSQKPSAWWTSASPCSPAAPETSGSATCYLCRPKTLDHDAARGQQLVHHAQAPRKADVKPNGVADDLGWIAIAGVGVRAAATCHTDSG